MAINCNWKKDDHIVSNNCLNGTLTDGIFNGTVWCTCKGSNKWAHLNTNCPKNKQPKRHIIARQFGGPRHGYNCWFNTQTEEDQWTHSEQQIAYNVKQNRICSYIANTNTKKIHTNCTEHITNLDDNFEYLQLDPRYKYCKRNNAICVVPTTDTLTNAYWSRRTVENSLYHRTPNFVCGDLYSSTDNTNSITDYVYLASPNGVKIKINEPMQIAGHFTETFTSNKWYVSGTPIFNSLGDPISCITGSVGDKYLILHQNTIRLRSSFDIIYHSTKTKKLKAQASKIVENATKLETINKQMQKLEVEKKKVQTNLKQAKQSVATCKLSNDKPKNKNKKQKATPKQVIASTTTNMTRDTTVEYHTDWKYDKRGCMVSNTSDIDVWPVHCLTADELALKRKTHHTYTDCVSNVIFKPITNFVKIGSPQNELVPVSENQQLFSYFFDGKMFCYQNQKTIRSNVKLVSGTPIYNYYDELCSIITQSNGSDYGLVGFYGNRGRIAVDNFELKTKTNYMIYGDQQFNNKSDLIKHIDETEYNGHIKLIMWKNIQDQDIRLVVLNGNREVSHHYVDVESGSLKKTITLNNTSVITNPSRSFLSYLLISFLLLFSSLFAYDTFNFAKNVTDTSTLYTLDNAQLRQLTIDYSILQEDVINRMVIIDNRCEQILNLTMTPSDDYIDSKLETIYITTKLYVNEIHRQTREIKKLLEHQKILKKCVQPFTNCTQEQHTQLAYGYNAYRYQSQLNKLWKGTSSTDAETVRNIQSQNRNYKVKSLSDFYTTSRKRRNVNMFAEGKVITKINETISAPGLPMFNSDGSSVANYTIAAEGLPMFNSQGLTVGDRDYSNSWTIGDKNFDINCNVVNFTRLEPSLTCDTNSREYYLAESCLHCKVGRGNIMELENEYIFSKIDCDKKIRCNLACCLKPNSLYHLLNLQPVHPNCLYPIFKILTQNKLTNIPAPYLIEQENPFVRVYDDIIIFNYQNETIVGPRVWDVDEFACFSQKLAHSESKYYFRNRVFMCSVDPHVYEFNIKYLDNIRPVTLLSACISVLLCFYFFKYFGFLGSVLIILISMGVSTQAQMCNSEVLSIKAQRQDKRDIHPIYLISSYISSGECVDFNGMFKLRIEKLNTNFVYNYKQSYPSEFKLDCCEWIFNCPVKANTVCSDKTACTDKIKLKDWQYSFSDCKAEKTPHNSDCWTTGVMNTKVEAIVSIPNNTNSYLHVYERQMSKQQQVMHAQYEITNPINITKNFTVSQKHNFKDDLFKFNIETIDIDEPTTYRYIIHYDSSYYCAHTLPEVSTLVFQPIYTHHIN